MNQPRVHLLEYLQAKYDESEAASGDAARSPLHIDAFVKFCAEHLKKTGVVLTRLAAEPDHITMVLADQAEVILPTRQSFLDDPSVQMGVQATNVIGSR